MKSYELDGPVSVGLQVRINGDVWEKVTLRRAAKDAATGKPLDAGTDVYQFGSKRISAELVESTETGAVIE